MKLRIFHTADLHLGMKFAQGYTPLVQDELVKARYETLAREVDLANENKSDLFLIAGDLFDGHRISAKDIQSVAETLSRFEGGLVVIMPGNHDYVQPSSELWSKFSKAIPSVLLMDKTIPYDLRRYEIDLVFYPGPCTSRLSAENAIAWMKTCPKLTGDIFHVGVAHGSVNGISPDFNAEYYPMTKEELRSLGFDLWLMGHTHVRYPDVDQGTEEKILFPGTPEPDGLDSEHSGYAWIVDLGDEHSVKYRTIETGKFQFLDWHVVLSQEEDLDNLKSKLKNTKLENTLVRLKLTGSLPGDMFEKLEVLNRELKKKVVGLKLDYSSLHRSVTAKEIDAEFTKGSFPYRLLKTLVDNNSDPLTIQIAYDLVKEASR